MTNVMIAGAGAIGKGVMVPLFLRHACDVTIANRRIETIVDPIFSGYRVYAGRKTQFINDFTYCSFQDTIFEERFLHTDILVLALRDEGLDNLCELLLSHFIRRSHTSDARVLTILICSNQPYVAKSLANYFSERMDGAWLDRNVEFIHVLVFIGASRCKKNPYDIEVNVKDGSIEMESSHYFCFHKWEEITIIRDCEKKLSIKLSLINRVQLYLALMGVEKGYSTMKQCLSDVDIYKRALNSYKECCYVLLQEYPQDMQKAFAERLWKRVLQSEYEELSRFLQEIDKKMRKDERVMFPLLIAKKRKLPCTYMRELKIMAEQYKEYIKGR